MLTITKGPSLSASSVALPEADCRRQTKPGAASARALMGSSHVGMIPRSPALSLELETADVDLRGGIHSGILPYGANTDDGQEAAGEGAFAAVAEEEIGTAGGAQVSGINV